MRNELLAELIGNLPESVPNPIYGIEGLDHIFNSKLGSDLEEALTKLRQNVRVTQPNLDSVLIGDIIKLHTGINAQLVISEYSNAAYVFVPEIDKNNVLINYCRRWMLDNSDSEELLKKKNVINGGVSFSTGKVLGDYCNVPVSITMGELLLWRKSEFTIKEAVAILLHEIGHVFVYFEAITRTTKTNYLIAEATKRLMNTTSKEQRVKILHDVEEALDQIIDGKEALAETKKSAEIYQTVIITAAVKESESQIGTNIYHSRSFEQLADNFASRHGYVRPLATGLDKLYRQYGNKAYMHPVFNTLLNVLAFTAFIGVVGYALFTGSFIGIYAASFLTAMFIFGNPLDVQYDPIDERISKLRQQINDALKDRDLPDSRKKKYLADAKAIDVVLDKMYAGNSDTYEWIYKNLFPWGRKVNFDIEEQIKMEEMLNNKMFTSAAALQIASTK